MKKMPSIDLVPMTTGKAKPGADVRLPGMKTAWRTAGLGRKASRLTCGRPEVLAWSGVHIPEPTMPAGSTR
jgi:hypothetical protein